MVAICAAAAHADPDLRVHEAPLLHLAMRPRVAVKQQSAVAAPMPIRVAPVGPAPAPADYGQLTGAREPGQDVGFQIDLGYAIDGTQLSDTPTTLGGKRIALGRDFAQTRTYGFADTFLSTHGYGYEPLSTYFAARFELTRKPTGPDARTAGATSVEIAPPIESWFDRSNLMVRSGWGELDDILPRAWGMPVKLRLGQLYVYGPWVMHIQGALATWQGKILEASAYAGRRAPDYTYDFTSSDQPTILGASGKIDLRGTSADVPIVVAGEAMRVNYDDGTHSEHLQGELDWRPRREMVVLAQFRTLDRKWANEHAQLRTRYKQVTNLVFDLQLRQSDDWQWDPSVVGQPTDATEARRYLDLGPVQPQLLGSARAGTVLFENIDVLGRFAFARDLEPDGAQRVSTNANYFEFAGALEVRLRRTIAIGISALRRQFEHPEDIPIEDVAGPQPLPLEQSEGQVKFLELGATLRMSLGARRLSASVEVYGRSTTYTENYCSPCGAMAESLIPTDDLRGGGRVTVDAYVGQRLRLFVSYDVSSTFALAPEITGYKSLRLMMEGVY